MSDACLYCVQVENYSGLKCFLKIGLVACYVNYFVIFTLKPIHNILGMYMYQKVNLIYTDWLQLSFFVNMVFDFIFPKKIMQISF